MAAKQVSGGDIYVKKLIEDSNEKFDVVLSDNAKRILTGVNIGKLHVTDSESSKGNIGIARLYLSRIVSSLRFIRKNQAKYSTVISSSPFIYDVLPAIFTKNENRAVIIFHLLPKRKGASLSTRIRFFLAYVEQKASLYLIRKYFKIILAGNQELKDELKKKFPNKKIIISHAGIDITEIDDIEEQKKDPNLGIFVGRLTVQKGILDLVDIVKAIEKEKPKFKLIIIGDGPDKQLLKKKINREGLKSISFAGFVDKDTKYKLMKEAKFFIFPSREEGWGIALAEALYCQCLCFCYELPHYRGLFASYPLYVALDDSKELSRRVITHYDMSPKPAQQKFIKQYDHKLVVEDVFRQIND